MKKNNIILTGLMGSGKTTIGRAYSKRYNMSFIDLDEFIEKNENKKINDIFKKFGESYFRRLESQAISDISSYKNFVISTGGGILENEENIKRLKEIGYVIYLKSSVETLYGRVKNDDKRPLLNCANPKDKLKELLEKREKNYLKADFVINSEQKIDKIIEEINEKIKS